jgi:hypothetical protein
MAQSLFVTFQSQRLAVSLQRDLATVNLEAMDHDGPLPQTTQK